MSGTQAPVWVTVLLAVLAVAGTIGGTLCGQFVAGRNDRRRWDWEHEREAQAFWREKRLEVYTTVLAAAHAALDGLHGKAGLPQRRDKEELVTSMEHVEGDLRTLWVIGRTPTADLAMSIRATLLYMDAVLGLPEDKRGSISLEKVEKDLKEVAQMVGALRGAFRADLGVTIGDPEPRERRRRWSRLRRVRGTRPIAPQQLPDEGGRHVDTPRIPGFSRFFRFW